MNGIKQPTVRAINENVISGYVYVYSADECVRIIRARTRKGVLEGRVLGTGSWVAIPATASIELSRG